ncbi:MAG: ATP-binding protein [Kiritimatiellae bacterium]|nr:ATP-binding protein [Kiritimatiellia bacterium]
MKTSRASRTSASKAPAAKRGYRANLKDSWIIRQEFRLFLNMIGNLLGPVSDPDFFSIFDDSPLVGPGELATYLERHFGIDRLKAAGVVQSTEGESGPVHTISMTASRALAELWNQKFLRIETRDLLREWSEAILARHAPPPARGAPADPMGVRADDIANVLRLDPVERELFVLFAVRALTRFDDFPQRFWSFAQTADLCAMAIDYPTADVAHALRPSGRIARYNLVDLDDCYLPAGPFRNYLESGGNGGPALLESAFFKSVDLDDALPVSFHGDLAGLHAPVLLPLLARPAPRAPNVLFYGAPGTGKTSFAKSLARELGYSLVEITQGDPSNPRSDRQQTTASRASGIRLANERYEPGKVLLLVDEADTLLMTNSDPSSPSFSAATDKGLVNSLLDESRLPTLWLANTSAEALAESVRRRFDYSIRFDSLSPEKRLAIWRNATTNLGLSAVVSKETARRLAHRFPTNAGGIALALLNAKRLGATPDSVEGLLSSFLAPHCELLGIRPDDDAPSSADYSIDGLNVHGPVPPDDVLAAVRKFRAERRAPASPDRPRLNVLLYGPPGTGKTEFVKFVARAVSAPVALRTASSLLGPYVGETEANIRDAFRDAASSASILFLDDFDGLLFDRAASRYRWEYTQVNELLQGLENFGGVLFAATNHLDALDPAVLRRFTLKLQFDYLDSDGKRVFFDRFFGLPLDPAGASRLDAIPNLAPGDFRTVRQALHYLSRPPTAELLLDELLKESSLKRDPLARAPIGFASASRPHPFAPPTRPPPRED